MRSRTKRKARWSAVVNCGCGRINFIGSAPSEQDLPGWSSPPREVLCTCGIRRVYQPEEIGRTPKSP